MKEWLWKLVAFVVSREIVADYLIKRSFATPYFDLEGYMRRWFLFNDFTKRPKPRRERDWLPSIRIHHILREDRGRHKHDHPWDARTIILKNWYIERREDDKPILRKRGDTATLNFGEYHTIDEVAPGGTWTMFITYRYKGGWGFLVNGVKVPWRRYDGAAP